MHRAHRPSVRRGSSALAALLALSVLAAACGGAKEGESNAVDKDDAGLNAAAGESGLEEAGEPQRGGTLV